MSWEFRSAFSIHYSSFIYAYDKYLYVGNNDFNIRVWNIETTELFLNLKGHQGLITGIVFEPKTSLLFSSSLDGSIITWNGPVLFHKYSCIVNSISKLAMPIFSLAFDQDKIN